MLNKDKMKEVLIDVAKSLRMIIKSTSGDIFTACAEDGRGFRVYFFDKEWRCELHRGTKVKRVVETILGKYTMDDVENMALHIVTKQSKYMR